MVIDLLCLRKLIRRWIVLGSDIVKNVEMNKISEARGEECGASRKDYTSSSQDDQVY